MDPAQKPSSHRFPSKRSGVIKFRSGLRRANAPSPPRLPFHMKPLPERLRLERLFKETNDTNAPVSKRNTVAEELRKENEPSCGITFQLPIRLKSTKAPSKSRVEKKPTDRKRLHLPTSFSHHRGSSSISAVFSGRDVQLCLRAKVQSRSENPKSEKKSSAEQSNLGQIKMGHAFRPSFTWHEAKSTRPLNPVSGGVSGGSLQHWINCDFTCQLSGPEIEAIRKNLQETIVSPTIE